MTGMSLKYSAPAITISTWVGELFTVRGHGFWPFIPAIILIVLAYQFVDKGAEDRANRKIQETRGVMPMKTSYEK